jgi:hypothetical protein
VKGAGASGQAPRKWLGKVHWLAHPPSYIHTTILLLPLDAAGVGGTEVPAMVPARLLQG